MDDHLKNPAPSRAEAAEALRVLRHWAAGAGAAELAGLDPALRGLLGADAPELARAYPTDFQPDAAYRASLPDLQNGPQSLIRGAKRRIEEVGIAGFRLPLSFATPEGLRDLEVAVTGAVSLEAHQKGINMSRILRSFYEAAEGPVDFALLERLLRRYLTDLEAEDARLQLRLSYPLLRPSLRSGLEGYQYYDTTLEIAARGGKIERNLHLDYVYSSTCPCSLELSEHARLARGQLATPHSQRSVARISAGLAADEMPIADLIAICRAAVPTETQVMVKREDEQAFAELNAANPIFVEDAVRLFAEGLAGDARIGDFRVAASHQESLHSHDAVALLTEGARFAGAPEPRLFASMSHAVRA